MAKKQYFGVKYPFSSDNLDNIYVDLNEDYEESIKSKVLHVLFTPKGQKLRDPDFGTDLIKFIFEPNDSITGDGLKSSISAQLSKYVKNIEFDNIQILDDETDSNHKIVVVDYSIIKGNIKEKTTVAVKI